MKLYKYYNDIPILTYHKVSDDFELGITTVAKKSFTDQMNYLYQNGYQTILPSQYQSASFIEKPIIISFDDAYENIFYNAFPVMEKLGFKGLIFPIVNYIGQMNTWDANLGGIKFKHANKDQLTELVKNGWEIGSHSLNHKSFMVKQDLSAEVIDSKKYLEDQYSVRVSSFSFPFGRSSYKVKNLIAEHYEFAFSGQMHFTRDQFKISRSSVYFIDRLDSLEKKLAPSFSESLKLALIHKGAIASEIYQKIS